jgi:hypothetical protein
MLLMLPLLTMAPLAAAADASPRELHAAECVAALDRSTQDLAQQVKAGQAAMKRMLQDRLLAGAAFIGDSYLRGNRDEDRSRALADEAERAQRKLPARELAARQSACADEGAKLYADGNGVQKAVLRRLAKKRMQRLLGD